MKVNKQKIEDIKKHISNIKSKIENKDNSQVPKKYYALLLLMILLGVVTLSNNMKDYNESKEEDFKEYKLEDTNVNTDNVQVEEYIIDQSSISTSIANIYEEQEVIETISSNQQTNYDMPIKGEVIKEFAVDKLVYSNTLGMWKTHPGIDIKAEVNTEVLSASNGKIYNIQKDSFYGNTVKVLDDNGYIFVYSNLDSNITLKENDRIEKGDKIGIVGVSAKGELADEAHLHFEVIKDETHINPLDLIN